ncbi:MAG: DUF4870 domain-containing protein, partial [Pseudomonadota bacterium]
AGEHPMADHFNKQIQVFWYSLIGGLIGLVLMVVGIGLIILAAVGVYFIVMVVLGLVKALDGKPWG